MSPNEFAAIDEKFYAVECPNCHRECIAVGKRVYANFDQLIDHTIYTLCFKCGYYDIQNRFHLDTVINRNGVILTWDKAVHWMDYDILTTLIENMPNATHQELFDAYGNAYLNTFGEVWYLDTLKHERDFLIEP
ncbi:MAG: hypothetical protein QXL34_06530 [Thermosphaera sp.]